MLQKLYQRPRNVVIFTVLIFIAMFFLTFPSYFASVDEHEYLKNSFLLQRGTLAETEKTEACVGKFNGEGYVSQYFIGRSLFLIPFTWFGFGAVMLSGLIIHLLNMLLFYKIFEKLGHNPLYSIFYLLYPAFLWEARTLNNELLVLTGILAGVFFYLSEKRSHQLLSGFMLGLTALVRQEALLISLAFFLIPLIKKRDKFLFMLSGFIPAFLLLLWTNSLFYGGVLSTGYGDPFSFVTDIGTNPLFFQNLGKFIFLLALAYPLMIFSPFLAKSKIRKEVIIASIIFIIFYSQNSGIAYFSTFHPTAFTAQLRYVIPIIGLLLLTYPPLLERIMRKFRLPLKPTVISVIVVLFMIGGIASLIHSNFLDGRYTVFNQIYANTDRGSLLIGSSDDCNYVLNEHFDDRAYLDVGTEGLESYMERYEHVYLLEISYSTVDYSSIRGNVVKKERQKIADFIERREGNLELIFEMNTPNSLRIYRVD